MRSGWLSLLVLPFLPWPAAAQAPTVTHSCGLVHPLPRPCDSAPNVSIHTTLYFEVSVPSTAGSSGRVDPNSVTFTLMRAGQSPVPVLKANQRWEPGFSGTANGEWNADGRRGYGYFTQIQTPLAPLTTYTITVNGRTNGGTPIDAATKTWSFTTRRDLAGSTRTIPLDLAAPTVYWKGRWFGGLVKPNFDTSRMFDQGPVYDMMLSERATIPEFLTLQRDFPLFADYWQAGGFFDGNPNLMRERETRRILSMRDSGGFTVLTIADLVEGPLYGIAAGRPIGTDYQVGQRVQIADRTHTEISTVRSINETTKEVRVDPLATPASQWKPNPLNSFPADSPDTPDNFSYPLGALRRYDPVGTPLYYWTRLDDELDQHIASGRQPLLALHGAPLDACRMGRSSDGLGGECPDLPKNWIQWDSIVRTVVGHVIERYGPATADWLWSIGNEPDLTIFWVGTDDEFMKYYDYTANSILRAFEAHGLDASRVRIGGGEATGLFPGYEDQLLYHGSPTRAFPTPGLFEERNHVCIDPAFNGFRAARIATLCSANADRGTPVDFLSIHSYAHAAEAASEMQRAHAQARAIDAAYYENLPVNSHESTPDWMPRRDPDSRDGYRWGGFFSSWGTDFFRQMLDAGHADPRRAGGESTLTVWPFNYNFEGNASVAGQLRIDDDGDGTEDRVAPVKTPFWHMTALSARMSHDLAPIPTVLDAGVSVGGWRSVQAAGDTFLLYAHDPADTGSNERSGWEITLELQNLRFPLVEVTEYRIDREQRARAALAALPARGSDGLYRPFEVADLLAAAERTPLRNGELHTVIGGQLRLNTRLLAQGVVVIELSRPDPDADGVYDPDDNCAAVANPTQTNRDGDLRGDACDCAPDDPDAFALPVEVAALNIASDRVTLRWNPVAGSSGNGAVYDLHRESELGSVVGAAPDAICLASDITSTSATDTTLPPPASAYRYLVRARNVCGSGGWGDASDGSPRSPAACP